VSNAVQKSFAAGLYQTGNRTTEVENYMGMTQSSSSSKIHAGLKHPVIDSDGHWIEYEPIWMDYLKQVGGGTMVKRYHQDENVNALRIWAEMSLEQRRARRVWQPAWWGVPAKNSRDRATAMLPRLMYERLEEMGIDFSVLYPSLALGVLLYSRDTELVGASARAHNLMAAELFRGLEDRLTPVAVIPTVTPDQGIGELEYAVNTLGFKSAVFGTLVWRRIEAPQFEPNPYAIWRDTLGLESQYDYDPLWAKCLELKIVPTFHTGTQSFGTRRSYSNYVYQHIGHFGAAGEAVCKSLFLHGVTRRFPALKFAFLEGGVGWACMLYNDLIGHWKKRNPKALEDLNPANLDVSALAEYFKRYGNQMFQAHIGDLSSLRGRVTGGIAPMDDFARCEIQEASDIRDLFVSKFYFGCEPDDLINAWAFNPKTNDFGVKLHAIMSSDVGHWDVPDMSKVLAEAYELVEHGALGDEDFRDFVFGNPARFWAEGNPRFFKGTVIERQVADYLAADGRA
jgi:predicted TIM-barrel fold metal-dependent hydrolase